MSENVIVVRGVASWAKVLGAPRLNTYTGDKEWSIDVTPDKEGRTLIRKAGIVDRLREPKDNDTRKESFISFRHKELRKDGTPNDPLRIVNSDNKPWGNSLIGNGSTVDVKFAVKDYGPGKKKGVYIRAVRVLEHVPYEIEDFAPLDSDDEYFANTSDEAAPEAAALPALEALDADEEELDDDFPV